MIAGLARATLDLLLPPECLTCDAPVDAQGQFCTECFRRAEFVTEPLCRRCGTPFAQAADGGPDHTCETCREHPPLFRRARGALRYGEHTRRIVLPFKHADRTDYAQPLARLMLRAGARLIAEADVLVPVPLHRLRLLHRRYNQAALLAQALGRLTGLPTIPDALLRPHNTTQLGHLTAEERGETMDGAIIANPRRPLGGRRILLIDDVLTSGATADSCAAALLTAGAATVDVLVAARVALGP